MNSSLPPPQLLLDTPTACSSFPRAWAEVQRFLVEQDWIDSLASQQRDYGYLHGKLREHPLLAAERLGGYQGSGPFHWMAKEQEKKAFPLAFLLAAGAPLAVVQDVYSMYPRAISERQGEDQGLPLHIACRHGASPDVVEFLVKEYPEAVNTYDRHSNWPLHLATKCKTNPLHDKLRVVQLLVDQSRTRTNSNILLHENSLGVTPLIYAIKTGRIEDVVMRYLVSKLPPQVDELLFNGATVRLSFAQNLAHVLPKLKNLTLRGCNIEPDSLDIILAAASTESPISLSLANCKFGGGERPTFDLHHHNHLPAIREINVNYCCFTPDCFESFLEKILLGMPNLRYLTLTDPHKRIRCLNINDFLIRILRLGRLTELTLSGHALHLQDLIHVLAHHNTTTYVDYQNPDNRVLYYSTLNRFGRAAAQDPTTTRQEWLETHLVRLFRQEGSMDDHFFTAVVYGLLRECPSLWSVTD